MEKMKELTCFPKLPLLFLPTLWQTASWCSLHKGVVRTSGQPGGGSEARNLSYCLARRFYCLLHHSGPGMPILCSITGLKFIFHSLASNDFSFVQDHWTLAGGIVPGYPSSSRKDSSGVSHSKSKATSCKALWREEKAKHVRYLNTFQPATAHQVEDHPQCTQRSVLNPIHVE